MKRTRLIAAVSIGVSVLGLSYAASLSRLPEVESTNPMSSPLSLTPFGNAEQTDKPAFKKSPMKVAAGFTFYEDFESVTGEDPYDLPQGWTYTCTPGNNEDHWMAGTIYNPDGVVRGVSGMKYAILLPSTTPHDTWMFSPGINLAADHEYNLSFAIYAPAGKECEELTVMLCSAQNPEAKATELFSISEEDLTSWKGVTVPVEIDEDGEYYIGFHATSPLNTYGMIIDEVTISDRAVPAFYGDRSIDFGDVLETTSECRKEYTFYNDGDAPMSVELKSCSPEITIEGLPCEVEEYDIQTIYVTFHPDKVKQLGQYEGVFELATNVPFKATIPITVTADIKETVINDPHYVTFDFGTPEGYELNYGSGNLIGRGIDNTRAWRCDTFYGMMTGDYSVGLKTDFIRMGSNPTFEFSYALQESNTLHEDTGAPVSAEIPQIEVYISDDYEVTWTNVYTISPESDNTFDGELGFHKVRIELPEFAGKTCRARIAFRHASGDIMELMMSPYATFVDNIFLGTPSDTDLCVKYLKGTKELKGGETATFNTLIENHGINNTSYVVNLIDESGNVVDTKNGNTLGYEKSEVVEFNWKAEKPGTYRFTTQVVAEGETASYDNTSAAIAVSVLPDDCESFTIQTNRTDSIRKAMNTPVNLYACKSVAQSIYWANEMKTNRGTIHSLSYKATGTAPFRSENFEFFIGETERFNFDDPTLVNPATLTKVFEGEVEFDGVNDNLIIPFDAPYEYKGGNLVIMAKKEGREFIYGQYFHVSVSNESRSIGLETDDLAEDVMLTKSRLSSIYPCLTINMVNAPSAPLIGKVIDSLGNPVENAVIRIAGEATNRVSDAEGKFSIPALAEGSYVFETTKPGYSRSKTDVEIQLGAENEITIVMPEIEKLEISGKVIDSLGNPLEGVKLHFVADTEGDAVTDADGKYTVSLYDMADYNVIITNPFFNSECEKISLQGEPVVHNITLSESVLPVNTLSATASETGVVLSWGQPYAELRHDSGNYTGSVGFSGGFRKIIFGSAYRVKATVKSVSWYLEGEQAAQRANFNVFVFGLTDGLPDSEKILYEEYGVDYVDNGWNTHELTTPVTADGFMVAVSCDGFMGIGTAEVTDAYPYEYGAQYYAGDNYDLTISELGTWSTTDYFMLRAGYELEEENISRPKVTYEVYRSLEGEDNWTLAGITDNTSFTDNYSDIAEGNGSYEWKVVAVYANDMTSTGIVSNSVEVITTSVKVNMADNTNVEFFDLNGIRLNQRPTEKGIYIIRTTDSEGHTISRRMVVK